MCCTLRVFIFAYSLVSAVVVVAYFLKWHSHIHGSITVYTSKAFFLFCFFLSFLDASGCVDFTLGTSFYIRSVASTREHAQNRFTGNGSEKRQGAQASRQRVRNLPRHSVVKILNFKVSLKLVWISSEESRLCHFSLILFIQRITTTKTDSLAWQQYWRHTFEDDSIRMATHCS